LGTPVDDIEVIFGDTGRSPYGMDTYGSRSLAVGGVAILHAAEAAVTKARIISGHILEVSPDDLEFVDGSFRVKGDPDSATPTVRAAPPSTRRCSPIRTAPTCARSRWTRKPG
jgi:carbon-monoxide dehydrogenase large subunit